MKSDSAQTTQINTAQGQKLKVAYIVSHFPKLTETFVLYEMAAMEQCRISIELYPLLRGETKIFHPEAEPFIARAHYQPLLSWPIVKANLAWLSKHPRKYLRTLATVARSAWGNYRLFTGALGVFPKSVYLADQMIADGITHIHAHFARHPTTAAFIIHRLAGIPYSFTAHGSDIHCDRHMLHEKVVEAQFVVPISDFNRQVILEECRGQYGEKLKTIHCSVDTRQTFRPRAWQDGPAPGQPFSILCIGTLHEVKGQRYLLESCRLLNDAGYHFACHLIGDGPDRAALEQMAKQCAPGQIHFHGQLTRPEVLRMLQEADLAVTPSVLARDGKREGIPTVLMEAMASGLPVVASRISGIPELVEDQKNGLLVPPRDVQALAGAIQKLILDRELGRRFGKAGREKVEKDFNLHINAARLAQLFAEGGGI